MDTDLITGDGALPRDVEKPSSMKNDSYKFLSEGLRRSIALTIRLKSFVLRIERISYRIKGESYAI